MNKTLLSENFDGVTAPAWPATLTANGSIVTSTAHAQSAPNAATLSAFGATPQPASFTTAQDSNGGNVTVAADFFFVGVNGAPYSEASVLARCNTQSYGTTNAYELALANTGGGVVPSLFKRTGSPTPANTFLQSGHAISGIAGIWVTLTIQCTGSVIRCYVQRKSDGMYWAGIPSPGAWVVAKIPCMPLVTDTAVTGAGYGGIEMYADNSSANPAWVDNFAFADADGTVGHLTPDQLSWRTAAIERPFALISAIGSPFNQSFVTAQTENWTKLVSGGATGGFSGSNYNLTLGGAGASTILCLTGQSPLAPFAGQIVTINAMPAAPGTGTKCRVYGGLAKDALNYVLCFYDSKSGQVGVEINNAGTVTTQDTASVSPGSAFSLAFNITQSGVSVWTNAVSSSPSDSNWTLRTLGHFTTPDLSAQSALPSWSHAFGASCDATGGAVTIALGQFQGGYFGCVGQNDFWPVLDVQTGQPRLVNGETLWTIDCSGLSDLTGNAAFGTNHVGVWSLSPTTYALTERGKLFFLRGGTNVVGNGNGQLRWDPTGQRWIVVCIDSGNVDFGTTGLDVCVSTSTAALTAGVNVVAQGPAVNFGDSVSHYDADLRMSGGVYYLASAKTTSRAAPWSFLPALHTLSADFTTATLQWQDTSQSAVEGTRFLDLGGSLYVTAADGFGNHGWYYPFDGTAFIQTNPATIANVYLIAPAVAVDAGTRLLRLCFDNVNQGSAVLSNGSTYVLESLPGGLPAVIPAASSVQNGVAVSSGNGVGTLVSAPAISASQNANGVTITVNDGPIGSTIALSRNGTQVATLTLTEDGQQFPIQSLPAAGATDQYTATATDPLTGAVSGQSNAVTVTLPAAQAPVSLTLGRDGVPTGTLYLTEKDVYSNADGRAFLFTAPSGAVWPPNLAGYTITLTAIRASNNPNVGSPTATATGVVVTPQSPGQAVYVAMPSTFTTGLSLGAPGQGYTYDVVAVNGSDRVTLARGAIGVSANVTP